MWEFIRLRGGTWVNCPSEKNFQSFFGFRCLLNTVHPELKLTSATGTDSRELETVVADRHGATESKVS
jgi:hypothetical protein